jgi:hypothetical protein
VCSKHHDMWLLKIPGSSTGSLTIKNPGPELAEGPPAPLSSSSRMRGSILCSLFLWIPAYAGMTGESLRNPGPELTEGRPAPLLSSSRMRGSILCSLFLWIPAYAGMTGSGIRQPSLTLPALISVFFRVRPWLKCLFFFFFFSVAKMSFLLLLFRG